MLHPLKEDHLAALFEAALDAVVGMDTSDRVIAWNRQAEATFGWSREEAIGSPLADLIVPPSQRDAHHAGLQRYLQTGEGPVLNRRIEVNGRRKDGSLVPVELTIVPIREAQSTVFFAFLRDVTARRQHDEQLKQRALESQVLWQATEMAAAGVPLEKLFGICLKNICQLAGWPVGHIYLPDDVIHPQRLLPSGEWHFELEQFRSIANETGDCLLGFGEGLPGQIWKRGEPVWIADLAEGQELPRKESFLKHQLHAGFGFPIYEQGRLQAIFEFFSTDKQAPDEHLLYVIRSLGQQLGRVIERQRAQEHQKVLIRELNHRVGNMLSIVHSVFVRSAKYASSLDELKEAFSGRLMNMAEAQKLLAKGEWRSAELSEIVRSTIHPYCRSDASDCTITGPARWLPGPVATPLTMILYELATNAAKHGAFREQAGRLDVRWEITSGPEQRLDLRWQESGIPVIQTERVGYGTTLIDQSVRLLGGTVRRTFGGDGLYVEISFPLP